MVEEVLPKVPMRQWFLRVLLRCAICSHANLER